MRKLVMTMAAGMFASFSFAQTIQDKDVPDTVKAAFQKQYPKVKTISWEKENGKYEAEFKINKTNYSVLFDADGNSIETEVEMPFKKLPGNVKTYISKNYRAQKIKEVAKITDAKGIVTYEVEVKGKDLIFDSTGNFLRVIKDSYGVK